MTLMTGRVVMKPVIGSSLCRRKGEWLTVIVAVMVSFVLASYFASVFPISARYRLDRTAGRSVMNCVLTVEGVGRTIEGMVNTAIVNR